MAAAETNPWAQAQARLQSIVDDHSYENWFAQTQFESYADGDLVVRVPSQYFANWLKDHYMEAIEHCLKDIIPDMKRIRFVPSRDLLTGTERPHSRETIDTGELAERSRMRLHRLEPQFQGLHRRYTFERFVIGSGNRLAHAAAQAVVETPGTTYNPLFIYGATGLGKTHLMQAVGISIMDRDPAARIKFVPAEAFMNELIESIAKKTTTRFRSKYREGDVLLVDDVHTIAGKEATQEEFFHTFNTLFYNHKQIILSSDRPPKEIPGLEARLVSRFEWGMLVDLQPPDIETRMAILQNQARESGLQFDMDALRHIAACVTSNIRQLEGVLNTVQAYARLTKQTITVETVAQVLPNLKSPAEFLPISLDTVKQCVSQEFDVSLKDMCGKSRRRIFTLPRQVAMYLCKELIPALTLTEIGEAFGGKDHTTVLHACQKITKLADDDTTMREVLNKLIGTMRRTRPSGGRS